MSEITSYPGQQYDLPRELTDRERTIVTQYVLTEDERRQSSPIEGMADIYDLTTQEGRNQYELDTEYARRILATIPKNIIPKDLDGEPSQAWLQIEARLAQGRDINDILSQALRDLDISAEVEKIETSPLAQLEDLLSEKIAEKERAIIEAAGKSSKQEVSFDDLNNINKNQPDLYHGYYAMVKMRYDLMDFLPKTYPDVITTLLYENLGEPLPLNGNSGRVSPGIIEETLQLLGVDTPSIHVLAQRPEVTVEKDKRLPSVIKSQESRAIQNIPTRIDGIVINFDSLSSKLKSGLETQHYTLKLIHNPTK